MSKIAHRLLLPATSFVAVCSTNHLLLARVAFSFAQDSVCTFSEARKARCTLHVAS